MWLNPVFNDYCNFLKSKCGLELKEGYYFLDRQIIKCFDENFKEIKLYRIYINDDLSIHYKKYDNKEFNMISWHDLLIAREERLQLLENKSLDVIKNNYNGGDVVVLSSTGKDSMVTDYLVRKVFNNVTTVFNNTTLDVADTYLLAKQQGMLIMNPDIGFYNYIKQENFIPTRFSRACCSIFKEGVFSSKWDREKVTTIYMGMRNGESSTRSCYGDTWNNKKWSSNWNGVLPIREWQELDVWLYIQKNGIPVNSKYKKGYNRVGCGIACPYYNKSTWVLDQYWYNKMYNRWHNILDDDFVNNNKDLVLNCTQQEYHIAWNGGVVRKEPTQEVINQFAERNELDPDIAKKFFNKNCCKCNKKIKNKSEAGINMKYFGRNIDKYLCKKCFIKEFNIDENKYKEIINDFKSDGCKLF